MIYLLLFIVLPLLELTLLIQFGAATAWYWPVLLVIGTGMLGAALVRQQGLKALYQVQNDFRGGRVPTDSLLDGLLIVAAAAVLITPGIITDCIGLLLLTPPIRALVRNHLKRQGVSYVKNGSVQFFYSSNFGSAVRGSYSDPNVIDVESEPTRRHVDSGPEQIEKRS